MRLDTSQHLRLEQSMRLSPRIIQAMEILQLPLIALEERIEAEMQSNPVLELHEGNADDTAEETPRTEVDTEHGEQPLVVKNDSGQAEDFERLADFENDYEPGTVWDGPARATDTGERDKKLDAMANAPAPEQSLDEYLLGQWAFVEAEPKIKRAGQVIIGRIEDDGYLRISLEQLAKETDPPVELSALQAALALVQTLDPTGVGARDLRECLMLQLRAEAAADQDVSIEQMLVERFLRDIEMNRLPAIVKRTGKTVEQIKRAIETLSRLNPRPGLLVGQRSAPVISPDVLVELDDEGQVAVSMSDGNSPHLHISKSYRKLAKDRKTARDARAFLQKNIRSAQWLIGAIQQRRETVRRVAEEVFKVQREFLVSGPEALRPLPMQDIASKVGVHVATVSRAVAGKYAQTSWGIFPLRTFFSGGMTTAGGENVAWDAIRLKLKEVVDTEDKAHPLDDDKLAQELTKHGIKIARRTVAKYRELLNIAPARKRKTF